MRTLVLAAIVALCCVEWESAATIDPRHAANITVYHINQATFGAAPVNMDTGDAPGDLYFDVRSVSVPMECAHPTQRSAHDCSNAEVVSPNLVITKLVLEVDTRYGQYGRCNVCVNGSDHHGTNCTAAHIPDGSYVCTCGYSTPKPCPAAVGREEISSMVKWEECGMGSRGTQEWDCWKGNSAKKMGGLWFSTTAGGWCGGTSKPQQCTWRVAEAVKRVNKTCSDNLLYRTVEAHGEACFASCAHSPGVARNTSDPCWIRCFYATALGPDAGKPHGALAGMNRSDIVGAWNRAFLDPAQGGCPALRIPDGAAGVAAVPPAPLAP